MECSCILLVVISIQLVCVCRCDHDSDIIDLSYAYDEDTLFWPGNDPYEQIITFRGHTGEYWYESNTFKMGEHSGTHLDAPAHFFEGKYRVHEIPNENLIRPGIRIDISLKASINPDSLLEVTDLQEWEADYGTIPDGAILMVYTGWGKFYPNRTLYFSSNRNDTFQENGISFLHFPGISNQAAEWLTKNRNVVGVGIDTPSVDYGQSVTFSTHITLFEHNIYALENVANLNKLPTTGSTVYVFPVKLKDGSGAPARIFAIPDNHDINGATKNYRLNFIFIPFVIMKLCLN